MMRKIYGVLFLCIGCYFAQAQCWQTVAAGIDHTIAIKPDGTLWGWGFNGYGELGDGTFENSRIPVHIGTDNDWKAIAAGGNQCFAIKEDGTLWAWGDNFWGQLGIGTVGSTINVPTKVGNSNDWKSISAGRTFSLAIKTDGTLWAWGDNMFGQLGNQNNTAFVPTKIGTSSDWKTVSAGGSHTLAIKTDGTLWAWGANIWGELGDGTTTNRNTPTKIGSSTEWSSIATGYGHSLAIKTNGSLWGWGSNGAGEVGDGTGISKNTPTQIGNQINWKSISSGMDNSLGIKTDGTIWAWGRIIGTIGFANKRDIPTQLGTDSNWQWNTSGELHSFALKTDGTLWGWGNNDWGKLGDNSSIDDTQPRIISSPTPTGESVQRFCHAVTVADLVAVGTNIKWYASASGGAPLPVNTSLVSGSHYYGTQAIGSCESAYRLDVTISINLTPTPVPTGDAIQTFCGSTMIYNLTANGQGIKWYSSSMGGTPLEYTVSLVDGAKYFATQTIGYCESQQRLAVTFALKKTPAPTDIPDQFLVCEGVRIGYTFANTNWYSNPTGGTKLSIETPIIDGVTYYASHLDVCGESSDRVASLITIRTTPPPVSLLNETWISIAGGGNRSMAIRSDGTLWMWGNEYPVDYPTYRYSPYPYFTDNDWLSLSNFGMAGMMALKTSGEIIEGSIGQAFQKVGTDTDWHVITTGGDTPDFHSAAIKNNGTLWTWGGNNVGQLGDGTLIAKVNPIQVGNAFDWKSVSNGSLFSIAIKTDGTLWAWGNNDHGQLGDGTTINKKVPTRVGADSDWQFISAGPSSSMAIKNDGSLWVWGDNKYGKLGDGTTNEKHTPTKIGQSDWQTVSTGHIHTLAVKKNGTLWSWGNGASGALGTGWFEQNEGLVPKQVGSSSNWKSVVATGNHSLALTTDNVLWVWGSNQSGELGIGKVVASVFDPRPLPAKQFSCGAPITLADLPVQGSNIKWYTDARDQFGTNVPASSTLSNGQHYYATQTINGLESCRRLDVVGDSGVPLPPLGDQSQTLCSGATIDNLLPSGAAIRWYEYPQGGFPLAGSVPLINGGRYYASQVSGVCESSTRLSVTVSIGDASPPVGEQIQLLCPGATVGDLLPSGPTIEWFNTAEDDSPLSSSTPLISETQYYAAQVIGSCVSSSRLSVTAQLSDTPAPTGELLQSFQQGKTLVDLAVLGSEIRWYATAEDASAKVNALPGAELLVDGVTYFVTQTLSGCESATALAIKVSIVTGIEAEKNYLQFYPNPIHDVVTISFNQVMDNISVWNAMGQRLSSKKVSEQNTNLDFSQWEDGIYLIQIQVNEKIFSRKVIKHR